MGRIRAFVQDDIPTVAALNWKFLQGRKGPHPPALEKYFQEVFFHNPWLDSSIESLVYEEKQHGVVGFLGVVPRPMSLNGEPIQAAFGSSLVVRPESRCTWAGLKLLMAFFGGKQDIAMTDTSNQLNQQIWVRLGGSTSAAYGLKWARPLRPGLYGLSMLSRFGKESFSGSCGRVCGVLHKTISAVATKIPPWRLHRPFNAVTEEELEIDTLLHSCLPSSFEGYSLRPEYSAESLRWLLNLMSRMQACGNLRKVVLRDVTRQPIGCFIYYVKRGAIAEVVHIGAAKRYLKTVLDSLFCDARNRGAIAVHGRLEIRHAQELSEARCFFWGTVPLLFHARNPELARLVQHGDAFLSRLDGEWCLRFGAPERKSPSLNPDPSGRSESSPESAKRLAPGSFEHPSLQPKAAK